MLVTIAKNLALKGLGVPASFGCLVLLANALSINQYGQYSLIISIAVMITAATNKFYSVMLVREIIQAKTTERHDLATGIVVLCFAFLIAVSILVFFTGSYFLSENLITTSSFSYLVFITTLAVATGATLRGLGRVELGLLVEQIFRPVTQLLLLLMLSIPIFGGLANSLNTALATYTVSLTLACAYGVLHIVKQWNKFFSASNPSVRKHWITVSGPSLLILGMIGGINTQLPVLLMGALSSVDQIATYRVATGIAALVGVVLIAVNMAVGPRLAKIAIVGDMKAFEEKVRTACTIAGGLSILLSIGFVAFANPLINLLFSSDYHSAVSFLWICCLAQTVNCFFGPVSLAFNMLGKESANISAIIFSILIGMCAGYILIPKLGAQGAAISAVLSIATWNLYLVVLLKRKYNVLCIPYSPQYLYKNRNFFL